MQIQPLSKENISQARLVAEKAFSDGSDANLDNWFSFEEMQRMIDAVRGTCLLSHDEDGNATGMIYAQQENPINGMEGREKWVVVMLAVDPAQTGTGIGSQLLQHIEKVAKGHDARKMFVYTNKDDEQVIHFYKKNGYTDAGWIKEYQYGKDNSAVFLLKWL